MTAFRLVALLVIVALSVSTTGGTMSGGSDEVLPQLHMPEENFFRVGPGLRTLDMLQTTTPVGGPTGVAGYRGSRPLRR